MMEVDISNIWGELSLPDLLGLERAVFDAHRAVAEVPEDYGLTRERLEQDFNLYSYENPAWLYTAARKLLFGLGRTREQVEFCGNSGETLARGCECLPGNSGGEGHFVLLIGTSADREELADRAEQLAMEGTPVITLHPDTTEQLRSFFRFSAALWEKMC